MSSLIRELLGRPELIEEPPVLLDVGAGGGTNPKWTPIASASFCVGFDADKRHLDWGPDETGKYRRLVMHNRIATANDEENVVFFLTSEPACSSTLRPIMSATSPWEIADQFAIRDVRPLPAVRLNSALSELALDRIDWIKLDTQGTDLRLFQSLGEELCSRTLVVEFEPGIMDAYEGEDRLEDVMRFMSIRPFWMSQMCLHGARRWPPEIARGRNISDRLARIGVPRSPGWAELTYLNVMSDTEQFRRRDYLLGILFALVQDQFGFALELIDKAADRGCIEDREALRARVRRCAERAGRRRLWTNVRGTALRRLQGAHLLARRSNA